MQSYYFPSKMKNKRQLVLILWSVHRDIYRSINMRTKLINQHSFHSCSVIALITAILVITSSSAGDKENLPDVPPQTGDWLSVWNNNDGSDPEIREKRTPLTIAISRDEGKTWEKIKNIQDDPDGWYCYTAIHFFNKGEVLLSFCAGSQSQQTHLAVTDIALLNEKWIYE